MIPLTQRAERSEGRRIEIASPTDERLRSTPFRCATGLRHVPLCKYYNNLTLLGRFAKRQGVQESVQLKTLCIALPLAFPKLPTVQDDLQHSRFICLLVALPKALKLLPTTSSGHVYVRQVLPLGCPLTSISVPQ